MVDYVQLQRGIALVSTKYVLLSTGVPRSYVHGSLHDGLFQGKIETPEGNYYVEKSHHYYPSNYSSSFHSVIYSESHIEDPFEHLERGRGKPYEIS